jgi:hypothetical protein
MFFQARHDFSQYWPVQKLLCFEENRFWAPKFACKCQKNGPSRAFFHWLDHEKSILGAMIIKIQAKNRSFLSFSPQKSKL